MFDGYLISLDLVTVAEPLDVSTNLLACLHNQRLARGSALVMFQFLAINVNIFTSPAAFCSYS